MWRGGWRRNGNSTSRKEKRVQKDYKRSIASPVTPKGSAKGTPVLFHPSIPGMLGNITQLAPGKLWGWLWIRGTWDPPGCSKFEISAWFYSWNATGCACSLVETGEEQGCFCCLHTPRELQHANGALPLPS